MDKKSKGLSIFNEIFKQKNVSELTIKSIANFQKIKNFLRI
jgi:hypothetical protein